MFNNIILSCVTTLFFILSCVTTYCSDYEDIADNDIVFVPRIVEPIKTKKLKKMARKINMNNKIVSNIEVISDLTTMLQKQCLHEQSGCTQGTMLLDDVDASKMRDMISYRNEICGINMNMKHYKKCLGLCMYFLNKDIKIVNIGDILYDIESIRSYLIDLKKQKTPEEVKNDYDNIRFTIPDL